MALALRRAGDAWLRFPPISWRCWWEDWSPHHVVYRVLFALERAAWLLDEARREGWPALIVPADACRYWYPPRIKVEYVKWGRTP